MIFLISLTDVRSVDCLNSRCRWFCSAPWLALLLDLLCCSICSAARSAPHLDLFCCSISTDQASNLASFILNNMLMSASLHFCGARHLTSLLECSASLKCHALLICQYCDMRLQVECSCCDLWRNSCRSDDADVTGWHLVNAITLPDPLELCPQSSKETS